jgi:hypothetical protein
LISGPGLKSLNSPKLFPPQLLNFLKNIFKQKLKNDFFNLKGIFGSFTEKIRKLTSGEMFSINE